MPEVSRASSSVATSRPMKKGAVASRPLPPRDGSARCPYLPNEGDATRRRSATCIVNSDRSRGVHLNVHSMGEVEEDDVRSENSTKTLGYRRPQRSIRDPPTPGTLDQAQ